MSIQRLFLRKCIVAVLNNGENTPYPTLAENRVFDSKLDSFDTKEFSNLPIISVYTDSDTGFNFNVNNQNSRVVEVIIQFAIFDKDSEGFGVNVTDSKMEATLDILETQIKNCFLNLTNPFSEIFQNFVIMIDDFKSIRTAADSGAHKLAARQIQFFATIFDDDDDVPTELLTHKQTVEKFITKFQPLNENGHLTQTLSWLSEQIISSTDVIDDLQNIDIKNQNFQGS